MSREKAHRRERSFTSHQESGKNDDAPSLTGGDQEKLKTRYNLCPPQTSPVQEKPVDIDEKFKVIKNMKKKNMVTQKLSPSPDIAEDKSCTETLKK